MRFALDSNFILYCEGMHADVRSKIAQDLVVAMGGMPVIIPHQVLGETLNVMLRKMKLEKLVALAKLDEWRGDCILQDTNTTVLLESMAIMRVHNFQVWDAIILAAASISGADYLLSEDMQDGFRWQYTEVVNPFAKTPHPIIPALLNRTEG
jgi:predicted nucleic acid-binding protein